MTPAERIARAKDELAQGGSADYATAHALVAIAELLMPKPAEPAVPCFDCGSTEIIDTEWGWECPGCGTYDVAQGCVKP